MSLKYFSLLKRKEKNNFIDFKEENINLITNDDLNRINNNLYNFQKNNVGIILVSNKVYLTSFNNTLLNNYILYKNEIELELFKIICQKLLTDYEIIDTI